MHGHVPPGALLDVYRAIDNAVGVVLEGIDTRTTTVVVSSLHGMGANFAQEHFMRPVMDLVNGPYDGRGAETTGRSNGNRGLIRRLREAVPARVQHAAARAVPVQARDWIVEHEVTGGIDWSRTPGFALRSDMNSYVRLNVTGREPRGIVQPASVELSSVCRFVDEHVPWASSG